MQPYDCAYQHFIINSYTCLGQPGGGGSRYPSSTFWRAYVYKKTTDSEQLQYYSETKNWSLYSPDLPNQEFIEVLLYKHTSLFVQSWNGLMPMAQISYSKTP